MIKLKYLPPVISVLCLLLTAAHALRAGDLGIMLAVLAIIPLVFLRQAWGGKVLSIILGVAALFWLDVGLGLVEMRTALGQPWIRLAVIMGGVFGVSVAGAVVCAIGPGQRWFHRSRGDSGYRAAVFLLVLVLCLIARSKVSFPIFLADRFLPGLGGLETVLLAYYASWITSKMMDPAGMKKTRPLIWALFSLFFFSQLILGLAGIESMLMTGKLHLPVPALIAGGPIYRGGGYFMPILFTVSVLLTGPAWCSWLCYIGAWDDLLSRMSGKRRSEIPGKAVWIRFALLVLVVAAAYVMRESGLPVLWAASAAAVFGLAGVAVMLIFSRKRGVMVHCSAYCPMGIVSNLMGKLSPWRMRIGEGCTMCGACSRACRYGALSAADLERGRPGISCTLCGDCISPCRHGCIGYSLPLLSAERARKVFIVMVVAFHAFFLGVARI